MLFRSTLREERHQSDAQCKKNDNANAGRKRTRKEGAEEQERETREGGRANKGTDDSHGDGGRERQIKTDLSPLADVTSPFQRERGCSLSGTGERRRGGEEDSKNKSHSSSSPS